MRRFLLAAMLLIGLGVFFMTGCASDNPKGGYMGPEYIRGQGYNPDK